MAIQGFFTGDVKIRDLNGVLKAVDGIVEVATDAGTVTSVGLTVGSTGTDVNVANSPVTTSGNITLNLPTASATNRGLLSSADWTTFNAKQGAITLTTTGSSGAATLIGTTLNIPNYSGALTGYVPYTGATGNVDLGEFGISSGYFQADLTPSGSLQVGRMQWNSSDGTMDLRLMGNNVTLQIGQEQVARVVNGTGGNLLESNYQAVKIIGAQGQRLQVGLARADNDANSKDTLGLVTENINNNQEGFITVSGIVNEINTTGSLQGETWTDGDTLYLSGTTSGRITNIKPSAPIHTVIVGFVVYAHANHGKIFVKIDNGYELEELHDVAPTPYVNKGVLYRDTTTNLWKSATIGTLLGYTPANAATTLTINGTTYDLSANRTWNVGTVTSVGTSGPLTGGTITGSGTIGITQSSAASDGYLSNTDWATFNNKQTALNGTGFVKISGTTISYDNSTYYLASNPSAFIALTALSATAPLSYDNTTGVFSISQATTSTNGYLSSTDWNTFNNKQAAGSYITALTGEATASGPGSASVTLSTSAVTGKILTGLNLTGGGTIADTDSILQAFGKVQNQISGLAGGVTYQGVWNASTNTPTLTSSVGTKGYYYIVDVAGSTNLNGITDWKIGDWVIFNGSTWDKVDNTDAVSSVNGFTGAVSLTTSNIAEGTNLYYLDSRARLALSFTAGSGAYDNTTGVITIPTNTSQLTNGANFITLSSLSASSPLSYNSGSGAFSIQVANGSQNGYLSSTDWTTFNSKQAAGNYVTTDTVQTITALKTFTSKVTLNTGGTDDQLQIVGTAPSVRLTNAVTGATINGFIAMSGATDNYVQGSVSGDMCIGNQNNGKILFGFGSGTATQKLSLDSSGNVVLAGGLTLGSTLSNGTYTYTLPGATGTLALVGGAGVGTVTSVGLSSATSGVTIGSTPITTSGTITLAIATASGSQQGLLSSTDWTTFNNKQNALTNPVTGTGTTNYLPKFTGTSTIGNSVIQESSSLIGINVTPTRVLHLSSSGANAAIRLDNTVSGRPFLLTYDDSQNLTFINSSDSGYIAFNSGTGTSTTKMLLTNSGNLGLGVTPSAWSLGKVIQVGSTTSVFNDANGSTYFGNNFNYNSNFLYLTSSFATSYLQTSTGEHRWNIAPSGTAGNAISFTQAMTLDASGRLGIGTTDTEGYRLGISTSTLGLNIKAAYDSTNPLILTRTTYAGTSICETQIRAYNPTNGLDADLGFLVMNGSSVLNEVIRIKGSTGNVGIGTTSPGRTLHVLGQTGIGTVLKLEGAAGTTTYLQLAYNGATNAQSGYIGYNSSSQMQFFTNDTLRATLDASGNLGLGVTPSAWSGFPAMQFTSNFSISALGTSKNAYFDGTDYRYITTSYASLFQQTSGGVFAWFTAPSGTAGNAISFTQAMTLNASGNLSVGNTNDTYKLDVSGTGRFSDNLLVSKNQNAATSLTITNSTSGTSSESSLVLVSNSSASFAIGKWSSGVPTYKILTASCGYLYNAVAGDISILNDFTSGAIKLAAGGSTTAHLTIASTGAATFSSTIKTGAPSGGTAQPWKLGTVYTGTCVPSDFGSFGSWFTGTVIEIEVNGTTYKIPAVIDNYC